MNMSLHVERPPQAPATDFSEATSGIQSAATTPLQMALNQSSAVQRILRFQQALNNQGEFSTDLESGMPIPAFGHRKSPPETTSFPRNKTRATGFCGHLKIRESGDDRDGPVESGNQNQTQLTGGNHEVISRLFKEYLHSLSECSAISSTDNETS